jgi:fused signal recognition particle receptor
MLVAVLILLAASGGYALIAAPAHSAAPAQSAAPAPTAPASGQPSPGPTLPRVEIPPITGKTGSFDIIAVDQSIHRLYLADQTDLGIDVFDLATSPARYLKTVSLGVQPNGVAVAPDLKLAFTGNKDSTVSIITTDASSPQADSVVGKVSTGGAAADELIYDPSEKKVYVSNAAEGFVSVIDPARRVVVKKLPSLGKLGGLAYNQGDRKVYLAGEGNNLIYRIDPTSDQVVAKSSIAVPCAPRGIAVNPSTGQGLLNCGTKSQAIALGWDFGAGKVLRTFTEAGAGDMVVYDPKVDRFFLTAGLPTPEVAVFTGAPISFLAAVPIAAASKPVGYDEQNARIYTVDPNPNEAALWSFPLFPLPTPAVPPRPVATPASQPVRAVWPWSFRVALPALGLWQFLVGCALALAATVGIGLLLSRSSPEVAPPMEDDPLAAGLARTRGVLAETLAAIRARPQPEEDRWEKMENALLACQVGVRTTGAVLERLRGAGIKPLDLQNGLFRELVRILDRRDRRLALARRGPSVWVVIGLEGRGTAEAVQGLAGLLADHGHDSVVVGTDGSSPGADLATAVADAVGHARQDPDQVVIIAGGGPPAEALARIRTATDGAPISEILLVFDASFGQPGIAWARSLSLEVGSTGVVLTGLERADGGGIVVALQEELGIPVKALCAGDDMETFDPRKFAAALIGDHREAVSA